MISEQPFSASLNRWQEVDQLLELAFDLDHEERRLLLDRECAGDNDLRQTVQELLDAAQASGNFLEESLPARLGVAEEIQGLGNHPSSGSPGQRIGVYRLESRLGRGGMGEVWLARRADGEFEHTVAIKLLDAQMDNAATRQRLRRERQILARLDHPNIARLLDGGTLEDGRPYFVMERVVGEAIDLFCARRRLPLAERLRLVLELCDAITSAHRQGMIHRDLKPSNVLVTPDGTVKLVDFGIAKRVQAKGIGNSRNGISRSGLPLAGQPLTGQPLTGLPLTGLTLTALTLTGQRPMTPGYASPEQVRGEAVTIATDIYGLGALCYELLTGCRPFAVAGLPVYAVEQAVCEHQVQLPSSAVVQGTPRLISAADGATFSLSPPEPPSKLHQWLKVNLDRILLRALSKNAEDRQPSARQLARELKGSLGPMEEGVGRKFLLSKHLLRRALPALLLAFVALGLKGFSAPSAPDHTAAAAPWALRLPQMEEILRISTPAQGPRLLFIPLAAEGEHKQAMTFLLSKALWTSLSSRRDLQVIGERSAYEVLRGGLGTNARSMAAAVDAAFVLSGRTVGEGSSFRLETQLLWAVDGRTVWSQDYALEDTDVVEVLEDILAATGHALGLRARATGNLARFVTGWSAPQHHWPSQAALGYAMAYYLSERNNPDLKEAEQHLLRALEEDPELAPAWTLLARLQQLRLQLPPTTGLATEPGLAPEDLLERALTLDPQDHFAHLLLGSLKMGRDFDLEAASSSILDSLRALPMFTPAIYKASWLAASSGDLDAAVILAERTTRLDPLDANDHQNAADVLFSAGRLEAALEHLEIARVLQPDHLGLEFLRSRVVAARGQTTAALEIAKLEVSPGFRALGITLAEDALGRRQAADDSLDWLIRYESEAFAFQIAQAYACRGALSETLHWLRIAHAQQDPGLTVMRSEPCFVAIKEQPRLQQLVAEILPLPPGSVPLEFATTTSAE